MAPQGERLLREDRLLRRPDYLRCYRRGRRRSGAFVILYFVPNQLGRPRFGTTVSRKVGGSVVRHRVQRRLREIFRRWGGRAGLPGLDLVVQARPAVAGASFAQLAAELERLLADLAEGRR